MRADLEKLTKMHADLCHALVTIRKVADGLPRNVELTVSSETYRNILSSCAELVEGAITIQETLIDIVKLKENS